MLVRDQRLLGSKVALNAQNLGKLSVLRRAASAASSRAQQTRVINGSETAANGRRAHLRCRIEQSVILIREIARPRRIGQLLQAMHEPSPEALVAGHERGQQLQNQNCEHASGKEPSAMSHAERTATMPQCTFTKTSGLTSAHTSSALIALWNCDTDTAC